MPSHPFFSDNILSFPAGLAATIGLHEAILLNLLNHAASIQSQPWARISTHIMRQQLPFWTEQTIEQTLQSLLKQGVLQLHGPGFLQTEQLVYQFTHAHVPKVPNNSLPMAPTVALSGEWQPNADTLQRLQQHGIAASFCLAQLDAFRLQAQEQGSHRNDWNQRFFRYVKNQWVYATHQANSQYDKKGFQLPNQDPTTIDLHWQPSTEAVEILQRDQIDPNFIHDAVAEFILYWSERGEAHKTWNTKFVHHVRMQWHRFVSSEEHVSKPMPITEQWQPSEDCFDVIGMAYIDRSFAEALVPEFVLFWRDSGQIHSSWNSRFLQYVKQQWGKRLATGGIHGQSSVQASYATAQGSAERLQDTSWAKQ